MTQRTLDHIENHARAEIQTEHPIENEAEKKTIFQAIGARISAFSDKVKTWSLPKGIDLHQYRFMKKMYENMSTLNLRGDLVLRKDWVRVVEGSSEAKDTMGDSMDAKFDVLDFLLQKYLPEDIKNDEDRYHEVRRFFIDDFGLLPALA